MPALHLKDNDTLLAQIDDADLAVMINVMEEESSTDQDYFVDISTVQLLKNAGASESLIAVLSTAIGTSDGIDVIWR